MEVYIRIQQPQEEVKTVPARIMAVHEDSADLELENGTVLLGWCSAMYDVDGNEISLETVRRDFLPTDTAALFARIAELEKLATNNG